MNVIRPRSIGARLFRTLVIAIGALVGIAAAGWQFTVEPALRRGVARHQQEVARRAADQINEFIEHRIQILSAAGEIGRLWQEAQSRRKEVLYHVLKQEPTLEEVSLATLDGAELIRLSRSRVFTNADLRDVGNEEYFLQAAQGKSYLSEVHHARTAEPMVTIAVPFKANAREVSGVLSAEINLKTLWSSVSHIKVGQAGYGFVVDRHGILIAHPDHSKVLLGMAVTGHPLVRATLGGRAEAQALGDPVTDETGTPVIASVAVATRPGWAVVIQEPVSTALAEVRRLAQLALTLVVVAAAGAFGISYWFSHWIGKPIRLLREGVERVARGDLAHRLAVFTHDEIEQLAGRFNEMAERLRVSKGQVEANLATLQRALRVRSAANEALVRATDEGQFLDAICRIFLDVGGYLMAWVGRAEHDAAGAVRPVAQAGPAMEYLRRAAITWHDTERGRGPTGTAIRTRRPSISRFSDAAFTPWREEAIRHGFAANLALPLVVDGQTYGALGIYSGTTDAFDDAEVELLASLAEDVSYGISSLRARADRAAAVENLERRERRFRNLIEHSADAITLTDREGTILDVSPSTARLLGYAASEMIGRRWSEFIHPDDKAGEPRAVEGQDTKGKALSRFTVRLRHADGSWRWVEAIRNDLLAEPDVNAVVFNWWDITERMQSEEARRGLEDQLRQSQKMEAVGQLAGGIAHDFNNVLTVITGRTHLLLDGGTLDDSARRDLVLVRQAADRAAAMTRQLLAFSRKQILEPKVIDLNVSVAGMGPLLRRLIGEHIELMTVLGPGLGKVKADPSQLEQVLMNLVVNARDAMPDGGRLILETANTTLDDTYARQHAEVRPGRYVMLGVSDTGLGMTPAVRARIFDPFFTTKEPGKGTGLGLATVYGIVKQSDGHVGVYSEVGRGTTFKIYLPRVDEATAEGDVDDGAAPSLPGSEIVLLAEDEEAVRELAREILEMNGYTVLVAGSPQEAIEIAEQHDGPLDLLVTDVVMPQMNGRKLAERLRARRPSLRLLYMSGYTDEAIVHQGVLAPGTPFLRKPFTPQALSRKVREVLDGDVTAVPGGRSMPTRSIDRWLPPASTSEL